MAEAEKLRRGVLASYSTADAVKKYTQRVAEGLRKYEKAATTGSSQSRVKPWSSDAERDARRSLLRRPKKLK